MTVRCEITVGFVFMHCLMNSLKVLFMNYEGLYGLDCNMRENVFLRQDCLMFRLLRRVNIEGVNVIKLQNYQKVHFLGLIYCRQNRRKLCLSRFSSVDSYSLVQCIMDIVLSDI